MQRSPDRQGLPHAAADGLRSGLLSEAVQAPDLPGAACRRNILLRFLFVLIQGVSLVSIQPLTGIVMRLDVLPPHEAALGAENFRSRVIPVKAPAAQQAFSRP